MRCKFTGPEPGSYSKSPGCSAQIGDTAQCDFIFWMLRLALGTCWHHGLLSLLLPKSLPSSIPAEILRLSLQMGLCSPVRGDSDRSCWQPYCPSASSPTATLTPKKHWATPMGPLCTPPPPGEISLLSLSRFPQCLASTFSPCAWKRSWVVARDLSSPQEQEMVQ